MYAGCCPSHYVAGCCIQEPYSYGVSYGNTEHIRLQGIFGRVSMLRTAFLAILL